MKPERPSLRLIAAFVAGLGSLIACQNATESKPVTNDPVVATGTFTMSNLSRIPDSANWRSHSDSGSRAPVCDSTFCTETFHLAHPLGTDSVILELWTLGIRTTTIYFGQVGSSTVLDLKPQPTQRDALDTLLLSRFHALGKASKDSLLDFGKGASSLIAYYARLILSGDPAFKGKPTPVGMKADSIDKALVYWSAKAGQTDIQLAALNLGLDTATIHVLASALIRSGQLTPQDTLALLHSVRITKSLSISDNLTAGGSPVAVSGAFSWTKGRTVSATISLRSHAGPASNVAYTLQKQPSSGDTTWSLDGNLTLQAASTADTGTDTLVVTLSSDGGSSAIARTTLRVVRLTVAGDTTAPTIQRISPIHDTTFSWATKTTNISWTVFDNYALSQVTLNDSLLSSTTALYQKTVPLAVGSNTFVLRASDPHGNIRIDTLHLTRQADTSHPTAHRNTNTADTILLASQSTFSPSWTVTDNALQSVAINGTIVDPAGDAYSRAVTFSGDSTWITLVATDSSGNATRDSILVHKLSPPNITPHGGVFQSNQTTTASLASNDSRVVLSYSTDKVNWTTYNTGLSISKSQILYARAAWGCVVSDLDSAVFLYTPTITPPSGGYANAQTIALSAAGAVAIEDSLSTGTGWTPYTATFSVSTNTKVFARSRMGNAVSDIAKADFAFAPTLSPASASDTGVDSASVKVTISGTVDSLESTQDTTVTGKWTRLNASTFFLKSSGTLFVRSRVGIATSPLASATVQLVLAPPGISLPLGTYATAQTVTLTSSVSGTSIRYTTDGSVPSSQSTPYTGAFTVGTSQTLRAIAIKNGFQNSTVSSATYGIADTNTYGIPWNANITYGTLTDTRDSQIYRTVKIGTQTWMAQNLNFRNASRSTDTVGLCYGDSARNCQTLGRLYDPPVNTPSQVCPTGWRIPSDTEWNILFKFVDSTSAGMKLKSNAGWENSGSGLDAYGFRALPGGHAEIFFNSRSPGRGSDGYWWSTSYDLSNGRGYFWKMSSVSASIVRSTARSMEASIRCAQNP